MPTHTAHPLATYLRRLVAAVLALVHHRRDRRQLEHLGGMVDTIEQRNDWLTELTSTIEQRHDVTAALGRTEELPVVRVVPAPRRRQSVYEGHTCNVCGTPSLADTCASCMVAQKAGQLVAA